MMITDLQVDILYSKHFKLADGEEGEPNANAVPQSSHHGVPQHCADVFKERPRGHEVAAVQDDGREHVEEEDVGVEHRGGLLLHWVHDGANDKADGNQEAWLRDPDGYFLINVKTWREDMNQKERSDLQTFQTAVIQSDIQDKYPQTNPIFPSSSFIHFLTYQFWQRTPAVPTVWTQRGSGSEGSP